MSADQRKKAKELFEIKAVKSAEFSAGTYLVEVVDGDTTYWPFLQISDEKLSDGFCSCPVRSTGANCCHIAAAFKWAFHGGLKHKGFEKSLFKQLGIIGFKRHGLSPEMVVSKDKKSLKIFSAEKKELFELKAIGEKASDWLKDKVLQRQEETEETSIKFSGLSFDELELYRQGTPSLELGFELSFWSDLFKELFLAPSFGRKNRFGLEKVKDMPSYVVIENDRFHMKLFMAKGNWCEVASYLDTVDFPLPFHAFQDVEVEDLVYEPASQTLKIHTFLSKEKKGEKKVDLGEVYFVDKRGFFPYHHEPLLDKKELKAEEITHLFDKYPKMVQRHLKTYEVSSQPLEFNYALEVDDKDNLVITTYAFTAGDLQQMDVAEFGSWLFIPGRGFCKMGPRRFKAFEWVIDQKDVEGFVEKNREWLESQEGFAVQALTMQVSLCYQVLDDKSIAFFRDDAAFKRDETMRAFGRYVYVQDKGFYLKAEPREMRAIRAGQKVAYHEASLFIKDHKDDLEQIKGFFASKCPIDKRGLKVYLSDESEIVCEPVAELFPEYSKGQVKLFGEFSYVEGEGFFHLPDHLTLPAEYTSKKVITKENEPFFIQFEIKNLEPITIDIDHRLKVAEHLDIAISSITMDKLNPGVMHVAMHYESEYGKTSLAEMKNFLSSGMSYAAMDSGLVFFDQPRFHWLNLIQSESIHEGVLTMRVLEWIRMRTHQSIRLKPKKGGQGEKALKEIITGIETLSSRDVLNLDGLKSVLRSYQNMGVQWLWGLYCYGLSGLLCDDMGLGKTHQAMALISAISNSKAQKKVKCLIVCPTSVLYHWEDLLAKFLPGLKAGLYYGISRSLTRAKNHQIMLTSYGVLRGDIHKLKEVGFDVAIFDEIQTAKNVSSQVHKALLLVKASSKVGLTGTPIENRLTELKALFDIILPKYLPTNVQYKEQFVAPIEKYGDIHKKKLLSKLVGPFILRRKKSEVLDDLPEKTEELAYCDLSKEQQALYNQVTSRDAGGYYNDKGEVVAMHVFAMLNKLKQVCNHPCLVTGQLDKYDQIPCGKWELFKQLFYEAQNSGQKVVIFTQYLDMIKIFKAFLEKEGIGYSSLQGSTTNRKEQIMRFKDDDKCMVFVGSLKAAGTGIDLTAGSVVIHYDRWWNPAKENQATDRVHRIGQSRGVQVFKMVTKGTLEEYIDELILRKQGLLETVVGYDEMSEVKSIDKETLKVILSKMGVTPPPSGAS